MQTQVKCAEKPSGKVTNYKLKERASREGKKRKPLAEPKGLGELLAEVRVLTDGWPRRVGGMLFAHEAGEETIQELTNTDELFSWLWGKIGVVDWKVGTNLITKKEFFSALKQNSPRYWHFERLPHWPKVDGHYYLSVDPEVGDGSKLDTLVDFFTPATEADRAIIKAMFCTPFWGGPGGARPAFVITSDDGQGSGKSTLASAVARLAGGSVEIGRNDAVADIKTRLLSSEGMSRRIVVADNLKSLRMSWADLESIITSGTVSGKRLYQGEGQRPNTLTWIVTLNGVSLSTDMAQRSVIVQVKKGKYTHDFLPRLHGFIDTHHKELLGDIRKVLESPPHPLGSVSRWGAWESGVLARVDKPEAIQLALRDRQTDSDDDREEGEMIREHLIEKLKGKGFQPTNEKIRIKVATVCDWFREVANAKHMSTIHASRIIRQLMKQGQIPELHADPSIHKDYGRCFLWIGEKADPHATPLWLTEHIAEVLGNPEKRS